MNFSKMRRLAAVFMITMGVGWASTASAQVASCIVTLPNGGCANYNLNISNVLTTGGATLNINNTTPLMSGLACGQAGPLMAAPFTNNFTNQAGFAGGTVDVSPGNAFQLTITRPGTTNAYAVAVYIDWNNDGNFTDDAANGYWGFGNIAGTIVGPFAINCPPGTLPGYKRMRIMSDFNGTWGGPPPAAQACVSSTFGEVEDYSVQVASALPDVAALDILMKNPITNANLQVPFLPGNYNSKLLVQNVSSTLGCNVVGFTINWSVSTNGGAFIAQAPVVWTGAIGVNDTVEVPLQNNFNYALGQFYQIQATIVGVTSGGAPCPGIEVALANNTITRSRAGGISPGIYTVYGSSPNFVNFQTLAGILNNGGISGTGDVIFRVRPGTYSNSTTDRLDLASIPRTGTSPITFESENGSALTTTFSFGLAPGNIQLTGTDFIGFRNLTFSTNNTANNVMRMNQGAADGAPGCTNVWMDGCTLTGQVNASTSQASALVWAPGINFEQFKVTNSSFNNGSWGLYMDGSASAAPNGQPNGVRIGDFVNTGTGLTKMGNTFSNFSTGAIFTNNCVGQLVFGNEISTSNASGTMSAGIRVQSVRGGGDVRANRIRSAGAGFIAGSGIHLNTVAAVGGQFDFRDNMVNIGNGSNPANGILLSSPNNVRVIHNTVNCNTNAVANSSALQVNSPALTVPQCIIQNNILINRGTGTAYSVIGAPTTANYSSDFNNYVSNGNPLAVLNGNHATLVQLKATGFDQNSKNVTPFFSAIDLLHIAAADPNMRARNGVLKNNVVTPPDHYDIDGEARKDPAYMGADEVRPIVTFGPPMLPSSDSGCYGYTFTLPTAVHVSFQLPFSVQWRKNAQDLMNIPTKILGATVGTPGSPVINSPATAPMSTILTVNNAEAEDAGIYDAIVEVHDGATEFGSPSGQKEASTPVNVKVNYPVSITENPISIIVCKGGKGILTVIADLQKGSVWGYQWFRDGKPLSNGQNIDGVGKITGAQGPGLVLENLDYGAIGKYSVLVYGTCAPPGQSPDVMSQEAIVYVAKPAQIVEAPKNVLAQPGQKATFEVITEATFEAPGFQPKYTWLRGTTVLTDDVKFSGTASAKLTVVNIEAGDTGRNYRVVVEGPCGIDTSSAFALLLPSAAINAQPTPITVCETNRAVFTVGALLEGAVQGTQLSYQWRKGTQNLVDDARINGSTTNRLEIAGVMKTDEASDYNVVITVTPSGRQTISTPVALTVNEAAGIMTEPQSISLCEGASGTLTVAGFGAIGGYQWQRDAADISGATNETYDITNMTADKVGNYRVLLQANCGDIVSRVVRVEMEEGIVLGSISSKNISLHQGQTLTISVSVAGSNPTFQWYKDGQPIPGETGFAFSKQNVQANDAGTYYLQVTNSCGTQKSEDCIVSLPTSVTDNDVVGYSLETNQPNPFADGTLIRYTLPKSENVRLVITDLFGRELSVPVNGMMSAGEHGVQINARDLGLTSGTYGFTLRAGAFQKTLRMTVIR